ncbi:hypothetical protein IP88_12745 [alpha proteobacterium AAP81b]|nr:hypothetical protein IP88_12745 [alpha proteobacterium AAP81b]
MIATILAAIAAAAPAAAITLVSTGRPTGTPAAYEIGGVRQPNVDLPIQYSADFQLRRDVTLTRALVYFKNTKGDVQGLLRKRGGGTDIAVTFTGTPKGEAGWKSAAIDNAAAGKGDWLLLVFADDLQTRPVSYSRFDLPTGAPRPLADERLRVFPGDFTKVDRGAGFSLLGDFTGAPAGVPEPESWALLVAGFGLSGAMLRRRRNSMA